MSQKKRTYNHGNAIDKKLILSLIKDDMINSKLVNGLNDLGLDAGNYYVNLGETIFRLMGFKEDERSDKIYENYLVLIKKASSINILSSQQTLDNLALEIYTELLEKIK